MKTTTTKPTIQALQTAALTSLLSLVFLSPAIAADFSGNLRGVTITDAQASNKAPIATFTYTQNGDIITFDASGSSDPDGSIAKYKWKFGNDTFAEGVITNYTLLDTTPLEVTLTIVDNYNGVSLIHQTFAPKPNKIEDDFSTDTSANYTAITGGISVHDGSAYFTKDLSILYHNTSTGSEDHYVEANIKSGTSTSNEAFIGLRCNGKTGYYIQLTGGAGVIFSRNNGSSLSYAGTWSTDIVPGVRYTVKITVTGSTFHAYIDLNNDGDYLDAQEDLGIKNDSTYTSGQYVTVGSRSMTQTIDNLNAGAL